MQSWFLASDPISAPYKWGIWRECDTDLEYGSFFLSCSATLMFFFLSLSLLSQKWSLSGWWGAIDRLRKHILFCRAWQRLSCYLNNMSSAEVAQKIYLRNFYVVKSVGRREGGIYSPVAQQKPQTVKAKAFHTRCNLFFSIILVTLKDILTKGRRCFV